MATRLQVTLDGAERSGLLQLAKRDLREPRDQLRYILRRELQRSGLLAKDEPGEAEATGKETVRP